MKKEASMPNPLAILLGKHVVTRMGEGNCGYSVLLKKLIMN